MVKPKESPWLNFKHGQVKQLLKEIKDMGSNRDGDIQHFETQVEQLKATAKQHAYKLEQQPIKNRASER